MVCSLLASWSHAVNHFDTGTVPVRIASQVVHRNGGAPRRKNPPRFGRGTLTFGWRWLGEGGHGDGRVTPHDQNYPRGPDDENGWRTTSILLGIAAVALLGIIFLTGSS